MAAVVGVLPPATNIASAAIPDPNTTTVDPDHHPHSLERTMEQAPNLDNFARPYQRR